MHSAALSHRTPLALLEQVDQLRRAALDAERNHAAWLEAVPPARRASARNLLHYIGVRSVDLRPLQHELATLGLSSLGMLESHVMASLDAVAARLADMHGHGDRRGHTAFDFESGPQRLRLNAEQLLGPAQAGRDTRIMVTLPTEAADDAALVSALVAAGMDVARINCAHDDADIWQRMARQVRTAAEAQGRSCKIQIDLAGPKSRTGALPIEGRLLRLRPVRDLHGRTVTPARLGIWFGKGPAPNSAPEDVPLLRAAECSAPLPSRLPPNARLEFTDARGRQRGGPVVARAGDLLVLTCDRAAYIDEATAFELHAGDAPLVSGMLTGTPEVEGDLRLRPGDPLLLVRSARVGELGERDAAGRFVHPPVLHCSLGAAFDAARPGQTVWLDDGRIGATITAVDAERMLLHVTHAAEAGSRLKSEKGINFPETVFDTPALTDKDRADLAAMAGHVDLVALSFLRRPEDVAALRDALATLGRPNLGILLKIENRQAFAALPAILLEGLHHPHLGVMVARGDLAVEIGFERLSEVQEEILWLCEAAHLPLVWATQVLDAMARSGQPSRAEVTDAAMSARAECVMLNKGPHIVDAVRFLAGVLLRMEGHYAKRMAMRRRLAVADLPSGKPWEPGATPAVPAVPQSETDGAPTVIPD